MEQPLDVKSTRTELGMTQTQLADEIGVAQGDVSNWENGKHAPSRAARRAIERLREKHRGEAA